MINAITMQAGSTVTATVRWTNVQGQPATVSSETTWQSMDTTRVTVAVDAADSTVARITSVGPLGTAQVQASAQVQPAEKVPPGGGGTSSNTVTTILDITVISAVATSGTISVSGSAAMPLNPMP